MSEEYTIRFDHNGDDIQASYVYFTVHGRLKIWKNKNLHSEIDWVDWNDGFTTDDGFAELVISELNNVAEMESQS